MATEVLRAHDIVLPPQRRIRGAAPRRNPNPSYPTSRKSPPSGRRQQGRKAAAPAAEVYAGPAFSASPEPSSLPLPHFPVRKAAAVAVAVDDDATRGLRRILRLE
ncbi:hypothetical protein ACP70R_031620 [Stipagrostis hirtigluma subsp. patula]